MAEIVVKRSKPAAGAAENSRKSGRGTPPSPPTGGDARLYAAVLVDPRVLLVFGRTQDPLPQSGAIPGTDRAWMGAHWPDPAGIGFGFLGALGIDGLADLQSGPIQVVDAETGALGSIPPVATVDVDPSVLVRALLEHGIPGGVLLGLFAARNPEDRTEPNRWLLDFATSALEAISRHDGYVEMVGALPGTGTLIQGWSTSLAQGVAAVVIDNGRLDAGGGTFAPFTRKDLQDGASGILAALRGPGADSPTELRRIYFEAGDGCRHLEVVETPVVLASEDIQAHLAHMQTNVRAVPDVWRLLQRACRPQFDGRDSTHALAAPVRVSIDRALRVPGTGVLLMGWMLDPERRVNEVSLRWGEKVTCPLVRDWQRTQRPDVVEGFMADPAFAGRLSVSDAGCGFIAFAESADAAPTVDDAHLEILLADGTAAFVPVRFDPRPATTVCREILSGIDITDPQFERLVESKLGPIVSGAFAARGSIDAEAREIPFGSEDSVTAKRVSMVLPVGDGAADLDVNLARLAGDPDMEAVELLIVAGGADARVAPAKLAEWAAFYGFEGRVLVSSESLDALESLERALPRAACDLIALVGSSVLPDDHGWLGQLLSALEAHPDACAISPTLIYEDYSIRFAGLPIEEDATLARNGLRQLTGYPLEWLESCTLSAVHGVSGQCALFRRAPLEAAGGAAHDLLGADARATDLSLRLRAGGGTLLWTPDIMLFSVDSTPPTEGAPYWHKSVEAIDAWRMGDKWGGQVSQTKPGQHQTMARERTA